MFKRTLGTISFLALLGGCASNFVPADVGPDGKYIGWHCEGDVTSKQDWHCDKKTLKEGLVIQSAAEPAPTAAVTESEITVAEPVSQVLVHAIILDSEVPTAPPVYQGSGYSIQLGAYANPQIAARVVEQMAVDGDIDVVEVLSNGKTFSIVLLGQYPSRAEAQNIADRLTSQRPEIRYWIRSMRSVRDASVE